MLIFVKPFELSFGIWYKYFENRFVTRADMQL